MTHAPASPSAAPSERAESERDPSAPPSPSTPPKAGCRAGGVHAPACPTPTPNPDKSLNAKLLCCATRGPDPSPRAPPLTGSPGQAMPSATALPPRSSPYLEKKKKKTARLQPPQPLFSPPEGAPGVGKRRAKTGPPHQQPRGIPRARTVSPTSLRNTPRHYTLKTASREFAGAASSPQIIFESPGLGQILGGGKL